MECPCEFCGETASLFCKQCNSLYCQPCNTLCHQHPKRKGHQQEPLENSEEDQPLSQVSTLSQQDAEDAQFLGLLVKHFKLSAFKDWQVKAIKATINGRDTFVNQPTGCGKSLSFQFPPLVSGKMSLVITPTVSLMMDQTKHLEEKGIRATYLGQCQQDPDVYNQILTKKYSIIFLTPETLFDHAGAPRHFFKSLYKDNLLGMIAVDEVHLVQSWKTFRKPFKYVTELKTHFKTLPVMALTATATPQVKQLVKDMLHKPLCLSSSVNKENLYYSVHEMKKAKPGEGYESSAKELVKVIQTKKAIVYVDFVQDVSPLAIALRQSCLSSCSYHGQKMSAHDKAKALENWQKGEIQVMVCTSAFGLGVNTPDVDIVVRIGCPSTMEQLVQELGRAGRDGRPCEGVLFYREQDLQHTAFWSKSTPEEELLPAFSSAWRYVYSDVIGKCRRRAILDYFEESNDTPVVSGRCCDVCEAKLARKDHQEIGVVILAAINELSGYGEKKVAGWLRGSNDKEVMRLKTPLHKTYGSGSRFQLSVESWRTLIKQLSLLGLLERTMHIGKGHNMIARVVFYTHTLTTQGEAFLAHPHKIMLPSFVIEKFRHLGLSPLNNHITFLHCFAKMGKQSFMKLPSSTNAVESYNRISKQQKPDILKVAMMYTYRQDMAAALENLAISKKVSTTYVGMTPKSRQKVAVRQAKARRKRLLRSEEDDGPPDKRRHIERSKQQAVGCKNERETRSIKTLKNHRDDGNPPTVDLTKLPEVPSNCSQSWLPNLHLGLEEKQIIVNGQWLNDRIIQAAQTMLRQQFSGVRGLQDTKLIESGKADVMLGNSVQILHMNSHWFCISTNDDKSRVCVYDSAYTSVATTTSDAILSHIVSTADVVWFKLMKMQRQVGGVDCGLFAIAVATAICHGDDPTTVRWDQQSMRTHLLRCLEDQKMSRFVTTNEQGSQGEIRKMFPIKVHCVCRMRHNTTQEKRKWHNVQSAGSGTTKSAWRSQRQYLPKNYLGIVLIA